MKSRFDDRDELVCVESVTYDGREYNEGQSVVLSDHLVVHRYPDCFEQLDPSSAPSRRRTLREELEIRAQQVEELDEIAARERIRAKRAKLPYLSEGTFWRSTGQFLAGAEAASVVGTLDGLPDPAAEVEEEGLVAEMQRDRLRRIDPDRFWNESQAAVER